MLMFVIQHQPHRAGTDLRRELVACLLAHGSTFSRVGASGKPGAVQYDRKTPITAADLLNDRGAAVPRGARGQVAARPDRPWQRVLWQPGAARVRALPRGRGYRF